MTRRAIDLLDARRSPSTGRSASPEAGKAPAAVPPSQQHTGAVVPV